MKVHLLGPTSPALLAVVRLFQERGDSVSHSDDVTPDADVCFFRAGHDAIKCLTHGLVILDLRDDVDSAALWASYADLCLVCTTEERLALVVTYGCEPERIFVVADDDRLVDLVDKALRDALPLASVPARYSIDKNEKGGKAMVGVVSSSPGLSPKGEVVELAARLGAIERQADIIAHNYQVRSRVPVVGPLIAWVRRNLTSHLREPYLDPTLERQVVVNRELVTALRVLARRQAELEAQLASLADEQSGATGKSPAI